MTVSERVELIKFDEPKYLEDGKAVVSQRKEAEDLAKVIHDQGYSNIFLLGIGGTEFEFGHYEYLLSRMSDVDVYSVNAADVNTVRPKKLNKDSLVITASASGDTVEIVQAAKWMKEEGIRVVAFTGRDSKLGKMLDYVVHAPVVTGFWCTLGRNIIILYVYVRRNAMDSLPSCKCCTILPRNIRIDRRQSSSIYR